MQVPVRTRASKALDLEIAQLVQRITANSTRELYTLWTMAGDLLPAFLTVLADRDHEHYSTISDILRNMPANFEQVDEGSGRLEGCVSGKVLEKPIPRSEALYIPTTASEFRMEAKLMLEAQEALSSLGRAEVASRAKGGGDVTGT